MAYEFNLVDHSDEVLAAMDEQIEAALTSLPTRIKQ